MNTVTIPASPHRGADCWCMGVVFRGRGGYFSVYHADNIGYVLARATGEPWLPVAMPKEAN